MCKLTEQFMMLTLFLVRTLTSKRAGSHSDSSTENVTSQVKTESLIKKKCDEVQNHYFTQHHNEQTITRNFLP